MTTPQAAPPNDGAVRIFWQLAKERVGWGGLEVFLGQRDLSALIPPAVALAESAEEATRIALALRSREQTELRSDRGDFVGDDLPQHGDLLIVCDGQGNPQALIRTVEVAEEADQLVETVATVYPL